MGLLMLGVLCGVIVAIAIFFFWPDKDEDDVKSFNNWPYAKGSAKEKEALESLITGLETMRTVTGLCQTEKDMLSQSISFMKREIND